MTLKHHEVAAEIQPRLWEELRDPCFRWIWRAKDGTYLSGHKTREEALIHGDRNGWKA